MSTGDVKMINIELPDSTQVCAVAYYKKNTAAVIRYLTRTLSTIISIAIRSCQEVTCPEGNLFAGARTMGPAFRCSTWSTRPAEAHKATG